MEILKSGEASSKGVVQWRTRDTRAAWHDRVTVSCERHPLESPRFSRSQWKIIFFHFPEKIWARRNRLLSMIPKVEMTHQYRAQPSNRGYLTNYSL